ncbi:MAG TPA: rhomboid family intramembrane serine protease [Rhodanobacteraceae bacterium]|nr:rhomboid family intramembrane serine protease [Rhodanobacteraceae bacterium]
MLTLAIVAVTCVVSFFAFNNRRLLDDLILWPPAVKRGQYYRLLSYGLIHADITHLAFNMITLWSFGRAMEPLYRQHLGQFGFLVFYVLGLLVSILPTWMANRDNPSYRSLGASGAVSAVLFAYILLAPWSMILVFIVPVPAILFAVAYTGWSIYMDHRGGDNVNHSAHLWGAAYGIVFTVLMEPRVVGVFVQQLFNPGG